MISRIKYIGVQRVTYAEKRNILGIVPDAEYKTVVDLGKIIQKTMQILKRDDERNLMDKYYSFYGNKLVNVDLVHLFNSISFSNEPWLSTFETVLPRFRVTLKCHHGEECNYSELSGNAKVLSALDSMSKDNCVGLIALSDCARSLQTKLLDEFPLHKKIISNKIHVVHPPQKVLVSELDIHPVGKDSRLEFMLVGGQFFSKGGEEVLDVFEKLIERENFDMRLTVVSSVKVDGYATAKTESDSIQIKRKLKSKPWIRYFPHLDNKSVLNLMKEVHVGLLPTYADTYGYSVLEFQASGCPVISTNVRALPEINNNSCGWVIEVERNECGEAIYTTKEYREKLSSEIRVQLEDIVRSIYENRMAINEKAVRSIYRIKENHDPESHAEKLKDIYEQ